MNKSTDLDETVLCVKEKYEHDKCGPYRLLVWLLIPNIIWFLCPWYPFY